MKKPLAFLFTFLLIAAVNAQDKIITTQGDTIACKILSISPTHIHYEQKIEQKTLGRFIPIEQVSEYSRNGAGTQQDLQKNTYDDIVKNNKNDGAKDDVSFKRWCAGVQFGGMYMLNSTTDDELEFKQMGVPEKQAADYLKQLKHGIQFSGNLHGMLNKNVGLGLKYLFFYNSASADNFLIQINYYGIPEYITLSISERNYANYIALSLLLQHYLDSQQRFALSGQISLGPVFYRNESRMGQPFGNVLATQRAFAGNLELSGDYYVLPWLSVGAGAGLFAELKGSDIKIATSYASKKIPGEDKLLKLDYSLSIKFHF